MAAVLNRKFCFICISGMKSVIDLFRRKMPPASNRLRFYYAFLVVYLVFQVVFLNILRSYNQDTHANAFKVLEIYKKLSEMLNKESFVDNSGWYKIVHARKIRDIKSQDVSVVSQCSSNHFSSADRLFAAWEGPVSIAVYSEIENIEKTLWDMARFIHCFNGRDFGMQLVVPTQDVYVKNYNFAYALLSDIDKSVSCSLPYISALNGNKNYNWTHPYPINLLRNIARSATLTDYILVIDVDMIPSRNLRHDFLNFSARRIPNAEKEVYVVPVFEILSGVSIPANKADLLKMVETNQARPFYIVPCENCQKRTKYDEWLETEYSPGIRELYQVEWKHPWEPFLIAKRDVPNFDERFKQYGMNRVSQICELHIAGYKFVVLDNAFLLHRGYKTAGDFHETKNKDMHANRKVYGRFKIEIRYKYPNSDRSC